MEVKKMKKKKASAEEDTTVINKQTKKKEDDGVIETCRHNNSDSVDSTAPAACMETGAMNMDLLVSSLEWDVQVQDFPTTNTGATINTAQQLSPTERVRGIPGAFAIENPLAAASSAATAAERRRQQDQDLMMMMNDSSQRRTTSSDDTSLWMGVIEEAVLVPENQEYNDRPSISTTTQSRSPLLLMEAATHVKIIPPEDDERRHQSSSTRRARLSSWLWLTLALTVTGCLIILLPLLLMQQRNHTHNDTHNNGNANPAEAVATNKDPSLVVATTVHPAPANTTANVVSTTPLFHKDLSLAVLRAIGENHDNGNDNNKNPFYLANQWMLQDPNLSNYTLERQLQRFYLVVLYYATHGETWFHQQHWLQYNVSECHWDFSINHFDDDNKSSTLMEHGIQYTYYDDTANNNNNTDSEPKKKRINPCNQQNQLQDFAMANNNLTGTLPFANWNAFWPHLKTFDVGNNAISTFFPTVPSGPQVEAVSFANNQMTGGFTQDESYNFWFPKLRVLRIDGNQLYQHGSMGTHRYMSNLQVLRTAGNRLQGPMPSTVGLLHQLQYWSIGDNLSYGTMQSELGSLPNLQHIDVSGLSQVTGTIPSEIGLLSKLTHLDVTRTMIQGPIPPPLCRLVANGQLHIFANCSMIVCCHE